jgi:hypothetical protein
VESQAVVEIKRGTTLLAFVWFAITVDSPAVMIQGLFAGEDLPANIALVFL